MPTLSKLLTFFAPPNVDVQPTIFFPTEVTSHDLSFIDNQETELSAYSTCKLFKTNREEIVKPNPNWDDLYDAIV